MVKAAKDLSILNEMKSDWDSRALENLSKAIVGRDLDDDSFWESGAGDFEILNGYLLAIPESGSVVEIGCGPGRLLRRLSSRFEHVIGIDVSSNMIQIAKTELADLENVTLHESDGRSFPQVANGGVDALVAWQVFIHMPDFDTIEANFAEVSRVLRPGGIFVGTFRLATGWIKIGSIPVLPRRYKHLIPDWLIRIKMRMESVRDDRTLDTWRGTVMPASRLNRIAEKAQLSAVGVPVRLHHSVHVASFEKVAN